MKLGLLAFAAILGLASCASPERSVVEEPVIRPNEVADFGRLYGQNCSGCHGVDGQGALAVGIGSPVYLAIADDATIRRVVEEGRPGTAMPAFAQKAGGMLTDAQVGVLVHGIRTYWVQPGAHEGEIPPAYAATGRGDTAHGKNIFGTSCSPCHGPNGRGARTIADSSYLALVSDQHLRTVTITGMPQLGMPDWRNHPKPLSETDVTDVVAWLESQRQPLSAQLNSAGDSK
jgi:mono/diheme cytochrome c family protein